MKPNKKAILYTAYVIGIILFFLYYLFPSDTLKMYLARQLSQGNPDIKVSIDRISPVLPPGIKLHDVGIAYRNAVLAELDSLKIMPGILSLFSSKNFWNFKGRVHAGTLSGRAELDESSKKSSLKIDGKISGVQVQEMPALQSLTVHKISGGLGGDFVYTLAGLNRSLTGKLTVANCQVELASAVFGQKSVDFKDVAADLVLNNKILVIKECIAKGNQLDVNIAGTIALNGDSGKNALNLTGSMTPHHVLLTKIEKSLPINFLRSNKAGKGAISFKIGGTLEKPEFSLN